MCTLWPLPPWEEDRQLRGKQQDLLLDNTRPKPKSEALLEADDLELGSRKAKPLGILKDSRKGVPGFVHTHPGLFFLSSDLPFSFLLNQCGQSGCARALVSAPLFLGTHREAGSLCRKQSTHQGIVAADISPLEHRLHQHLQGKKACCNSMPSLEDRQTDKTTVWVPRVGQTS